MTENLWAALRVNALFWSGVSVGGPVCAALLDLSHARWSGPIRHAARQFRWFLPIAFVVYLPVLGHDATFRWRDVAALTACFTAAWFADGRVRPAILLVIVYAAAFSVVAVDQIMALEPEWTSTLFPAYIFTSNVYAAIAALAVATAVDPRDALAPAVARDLGAMLLGFALIWVYFSFAQFLVIWYGNLPSETSYIARRIVGGWKPVSLFVAAACGVVPVLALMPRVLRSALPLAMVGGLVMAGYWMELWLFVRPVISAPPTVLGPAAVTAAFVGLFAACISLPRRLPRRAAPPQPIAPAATGADGR